MDLLGQNFTSSDQKHNTDSDNLFPVSNNNNNNLNNNNFELIEGQDVDNFFNQGNNFENMDPLNQNEHQTDEDFFGPNSDLITPKKEENIINNDVNLGRLSFDLTPHLKSSQNISQNINTDSKLTEDKLETNNNNDQIENFFSNNKSEAQLNNKNEEYINEKQSPDDNIEKPDQDLFNKLNEQNLFGTPETKNTYSQNDNQRKLEIIDLNQQSNG